MAVRRFLGPSLCTLALVLAPPVSQSAAVDAGGAASVISLKARDDAGRRAEGRGSSSEPSLAEIEALEQECLEQVAIQRKARGLPKLAYSEELLNVARAYSRRMAEEKFFSHVDPEGRTVQQRVREAGIRWTALGENLALSTGYVNPVAAALNGWMGSPGHRRNILAPDYQRTAVGACSRGAQRSASRRRCGPPGRGSGR